MRGISGQSLAKADGTGAAYAAAIGGVGAPGTAGRLNSVSTGLIKADSSAAYQRDAMTKVFAFEVRASSEATAGAGPARSTRRENAATQNRPTRAAPVEVIFVRRDGVWTGWGTVE